MFFLCLAGWTLTRLQYASNVLLPEATYQVLLWRYGERQSIGPLSEEEENALHEKGHQLAHQVDFVKSLERLRELKLKSLNSKRGAKESPAVQQQQQQQQQPISSNPGGTRSRPKLVQ